MMKHRSRSVLCTDSSARLCNLRRNRVGLLKSVIVTLGLLVVLNSCEVHVGTFTHSVQWSVDPLLTTTPDGACRLQYAVSIQGDDPGNYEYTFTLVNDSGSRIRELTHSFDGKRGAEVSELITVRVDQSAPIHITVTRTRDGDLLENHTYPFKCNRVTPSPTAT